ncbi:GntR family regulatory protein [Streptantibioticus cattleyicolor NRRL 8057 = DSM 46488]|uniref:GntR family regulatory protein n=1 Tax=Streptantibioticus cattleyicolor (strain ATCC 35852 / DSM 46488 / JCM 4925 / NBRC 14057 / NRRL 8057) TaxID=1003195 RepID=G8X443_STREN|nr:GntR family regulatory protein [Streptantibioticus cattleyicolor NRRL 8057 = DSM 46488]
MMEGQVVGALGEWRRPGAPLAAALADAVRAAVLDGRLRPGSALPAERRLAVALGVSRGTLTAALAALREDGWVRTRHGSASVLRLPPVAAGRIAPLTATGEAGTIDLRRAVPAAPQAAYQAAMARAAQRSGPLLALDGEPGPGLPELRELLAARYTAEGLPTLPGQILVTSGARAALTLLCARLRPRVAAVEVPTYVDALTTLRTGGTRPVGCRVTGSGWDPEQLHDAFRAAAGHIAYLTPDFHNPTGALMSPGTRRTVAELAARHQVTVIADETLRDLDLRDEPVPLPRIARALLIGSTSKTVWGGLRIGWLRAPAAMVDDLARHPLHGPLAPSPMQQLTAVELLADDDGLLARRRNTLRRQRDHLAALLDGDDRWRFALPAGGLTLWLRLTRERADAVTARAAAEGLHLSPGPVFAADATLAHYLRVPYTPPPETLDRVAAVLGAAVPAGARPGRARPDA